MCKFLPGNLLELRRRLDYYIEAGNAHTLDSWQIALILSHNVVFLLALHIGALKIWLIENKLIRTCSTGKGISILRIVSSGLYC